MRVSPEDGGNLARSFPGRVHGSRTEQLAHLLTSEVLAHADVIVDLHTSNSAADMPLFVGCLDDGSPAADESVRLAFGLGMPMLWTHPRLGPGRTLTVAAERGIPALYVESPLGGVLERGYVDAYTDGVRAVLEACGLVAAETPPRTRPAPALWVHGDGDTDAFSAVTSDGFFERIVALLDPVRRGDPVGRVIDVFGREQEIVIAPIDGIVTTLQRAAAVVSGQPVVGVTPVRPGVLGLASDDLVTTRNPL
ncbi:MULTISPECIES: succinylglutamate desuccinylase/aspartoacylase family protein [unclassified Microbacterium]|uniref:succinylglutamate desuccinylase/aspartoacylase family protein n=1 Tax=unclassified Microbacterium TaxID=2609290 RepID=UPI001FCF285B|nr:MULTISPECIES: M14 family metallopeptidase [unclassified Microbacterium]